MENNNLRNEVLRQVAIRLQQEGVPSGFMQSLNMDVLEELLPDYIKEKYDMKDVSNYLMEEGSNLISTLDEDALAPILNRGDIEKRLLLNELLFSTEGNEDAKILAREYQNTYEKLKDLDDKLNGLSLTDVENKLDVLDDDAKTVAEKLESYYSNTVRTHLTGNLDEGE